MAKSSSGGARDKKPTSPAPAPAAPAPIAPPPVPLSVSGDIQNPPIPAPEAKPASLILPSAPATLAKSVSLPKKKEEPPANVELPEPPLGPLKTPTPVAVKLSKMVELPKKASKAKSKTPPVKESPAQETKEPKPAAKKKPAAEPKPITEDARPVAPEAKARIAKATAAAAKAAKTILAPTKPDQMHEVEHTSVGGRNILFITAECTPLAQTGGLGDAVAGLTKALRKRGHDARIVMPLYRNIDRAKYGIVPTRTACVHFGQGEEIWVGIHEGKLDGEVPIWFIDYDRYFGRPYIYDDKEDCYRFGVLCKAALQICKDSGWIPHVAHVHDWMTAIAAVFLKTWDRVLSPLSSTASVLTIHNIGYQGKFDPSVLSFYGFGGDYLTPDRLEDHGMINLLKAGIQYADAVTTVSPTYANEIRGPVGGMGMAMYLNNRSEHVFGIVNGVDTTLWNPSTDKFLPARYSADDLSGKAKCKRALQERFGLALDPHVPIFGIVSRFAPQKGFDLIRGALPQALRDMHIQVVALGTGDPFTENFFRWLHGAFPGKANAHIGFVPELAHLIEAGSDFFLMPSLYEPCGLNQMYSSLYGTLPVVRATGGLADTVESYNEGAGTGTGFRFHEISDRALYYSIGWAVSTWFDRPQHYRAMQRQGMTRNFTWDSSARQYENVYEHAMAHRASI